MHLDHFPEGDQSSALRARRAAQLFTGHRRRDRTITGIGFSGYFLVMDYAHQIARRSLFRRLFHRGTNAILEPSVHAENETGVARMRFLRRHLLRSNIREAVC